jgi:DNA-binding beta-propeller fold protein YncE
MDVPMDARLSPPHRRHRRERGGRRLPLAAALGLVALLVVAPSGSARRAGGTPVALVTAETSNELVAVSLPGGKVLRRVHLIDPQTVAATPNGPAVVVSPRGTVTLLAWRSLRVLAVLRGFRSPQIAAITPDGEWVYVTDAATGELSVIELETRRIVDRLFVGYGAHHLAISPDFQRAWVALGESARTIVVLDTSQHADRPRVIARIHPPVPAHDLAFAPDGRTVWLSSAADSYVSVLNARTGRPLATIPAGPPPQHIAFGPTAHPHAYITSGYGSQIEMVDPTTRNVARRTGLPYGSFNLAAAGGIVVSSSLLNGQVTELDGANLSRWLSVKVAPAARDAAISVW